jgi:hypothetical protein
VEVVWLQKWVGVETFYGLIRLEIAQRANRAASWSNVPRRAVVHGLGHVALSSAAAVGSQILECFEAEFEGCRLSSARVRCRALLPRGTPARRLELAEGCASPARRFPDARRRPAATASCRRWHRERSLLRSVSRAFRREPCEPGVHARPRSRRSPLGAEGYHECSN